MYCTMNNTLSCGKVVFLHHICTFCLTMNKLKVIYTYPPYSFKERYITNKLHL